MADEQWRLLAKAAGLEAALRDFPEDVEAAALAASRAAAGVLGPLDPAAEPWPPMRVAPAP